MKHKIKKDDVENRSEIYLLIKSKIIRNFLIKCPAQDSSIPSTGDRKNPSISKQMIANVNK